MPRLQAEKEKSPIRCKELQSACMAAAGLLRHHRRIHIGTLHNELHLLGLYTRHDKTR